LDLYGSKIQIAVIDFLPPWRVQCSITRPLDNLGLMFSDCVNHQAINVGERKKIVYIKSDEKQTATVNSN
jgi:hypothetical protein